MTTASLLANAGTPLMWAGCCQLIFGNVILGIFESWLVRRIAKLETKNAGLMITANVASMIAGVGLVLAAGPLQAVAARNPFTVALPLIVGMWLIAFVVTVLVEWWFVARTAALPMGKRSLLVSLVVQSISYICLVPIVLVVGSMSAVTDLREVSISDIRTAPGWVYHLSHDGSLVRRTRLDGSKSEDVMPRHGRDLRFTDRLIVEPTVENDRCRLMLRGYDNEELIKNLGDASQCAPVEQRNNDGFAMVGNGAFGPGSTRKFADVTRVYVGYWAREGIEIDGHRFALETPYLALTWRTPIVLPDGKVVAQFGDAIVLVDPKARRVAKIAEGQCGDVLLDPEGVVR